MHGGVERKGCQKWAESEISIQNIQEMSRLNGDSQGYARLFLKLKKDRATCMHYDVT
jgi:hypothetical protein